MGFLLLDKVDPEFRRLTDLLFFTDRTDVDWSNYGSLLGNNDIHFSYLWDRFIKSIEIFWDEAFWNHRLDLLFFLQNKKLQNSIETQLELRFKDLIRTHLDPNPKQHNEYIQYIALCKAQAKHKESLMAAKKLLMELPYTVANEKLLNIVSQFIPTVFPTLNVYGEILSKEVSHSARAFQTLKALEDQGIPVNKGLITKVAKDLFFGRVLNRKNRNSLFNMMKNDSVRTAIKEAYTKDHRNRVIELLNQCEFGEIEREHLVNIKSILDIDPTIADELLVIYADKLHARGTGTKKANIARIIRLLKTFPQFSPKKVLVYLSSNNRMSDIKYLMNAFPDLRKLAAFI